MKELCTFGGRHSGQFLWPRHPCLRTSVQLRAECFAVVVGLEFRGWFMWRTDLDGCRLLVHLDQMYLLTVATGQFRKNVDGFAVSTSYFYLCLQPFQFRSKCVYNMLRV